MKAAAELRKQIEAVLAGRVPAALSPRPLHSPELLSCGVAEVDALLGGGLPLGAIVELTGTASSGRTTLALSTLAGVTGEGHCCSYVDPSDALDPLSAAAIGVELQWLLWVRSSSRKSKTPTLANRGPGWGTHASHSLEVALRATDLLLNAGGFRAVVLDLADVPAELARRIPMTTWYRFRLQAEKSRTLLLVISSTTPTFDFECPPERSEGPLHGTNRLATEPADTPRLLDKELRTDSTYAQHCAAITLRCDPASPDWQQAAPQSVSLMAGMHYRLTVQRSRAVGAPQKLAACETAWQGANSWAG